MVFVVVVEEGGIKMELHTAEVAHGNRGKVIAKEKVR